MEKYFFSSKHSNTVWESPGIHVTGGSYLKKWHSILIHGRPSINKLRQLGHFKSNPFLPPLTHTFCCIWKRKHKFYSFVLFFALPHRFWKCFGGKKWNQF